MQTTKTFLLLRPFKTSTTHSLKKKNISIISKKLLPIKVTQQTGLECAYATITNILTLVHSGVLQWMAQQHSFNLAGIDLTVDIGYYNTTREHFRTLLFHVLKETTTGNKKDWALPRNVGLWPTYLQALCLVGKNFTIHNEGMDIDMSDENNDNDCYSILNTEPQQTEAKEKNRDLDQEKDTKDSDKMLPSKPSFNAVDSSCVEDNENSPQNQPTLNATKEPVKISTMKQIYSTANTSTSTTTHQPSDKCCHGVVNLHIDLETIPTHLNLSRQKPATGANRHLHFEETHLPTFTKALDLILAIVQVGPLCKLRLFGV